MRQIAVLSVLLGAALVGSYLTYNAGEKDTSKADQVVVYHADPSDIDAITWKSDTETVQLDHKLDAAGEYLWVTVTGAPPATEEPVDEEDPTPPPPDSGETVSFKGNEAADTLWKDFAPLYALRELTTTGAATSASFGFDKPTATVQVGRHSGPIELVVGGQTYGSKDRYVKLGDKVYLVSDQTLKPLELAKTRLVDRLLQPLAESETESVTVRRGDESATLLHKNREDAKAEFWARPETPAVADESAKTWLGKVMRMRVQDYVAKEPALAASFSYTVEGEGKSATIEVFTGDDGQFYAKSSYTRGLVQLTESVASEVTADLDTVLTPKK